MQWREALLELRMASNNGEVGGVEWREEREERIETKREIQRKHSSVCGAH